MIQSGYRFGPFTVDRTAYRLLRGDKPLALSPKLLDLLLYLLARPSALVSKEELQNALWPDVSVTENALTQAISELRQILGDKPALPSYIQTVARRGYRFVAPVEAIEHGPAAAGSEAPRAGQTSVPARSIAVVDFENVTHDSEFAWLATGIAETVTNDLRGFRDLRVVDRWRVVEASRRTGSSLAALGAALGVDLAVIGSYQRSGERLRITARIVEIATGDARAHSKVDGLLAEVFQLQDEIVTRLSREIGLSLSAAAAARVGIRETSSLEAYRAFTEGRLKLETLDVTVIPQAILDLERAVALDPRYALAHTGLANARFLAYEASRAQNRPDARLLAAAIGAAREAVALDEGLAEAHATLAFLLVSARRRVEALSAARRAVALEPINWMHHFRLGHAAWGEDRLRALATAVALYPEFAFAHFEMAMVHIARGALDDAEELLRQGTTVQDRQLGHRERFPPNGLHWLLGLTRLAKGDLDDAVGEFEREIESPSAGQVYAAEFAMNAHDGLGFAMLQRGDRPAAAASFRRALDLYPDHARSRLGLAVALRDKQASDASAEFAKVKGAISELAAGGRTVEAAMVSAFALVVEGRPGDAVPILDEMLRAAPDGFAGWTIPIEPFFGPLRAEKTFGAILRRLAERAR